MCVCGACTRVCLCMHTQARGDVLLSEPLPRFLETRSLNKLRGRWLASKPQQPIYLWTKYAWGDKIL